MPNTHPNNDQLTTRFPLALPVWVSFFVTVPTWMTWYVTHLPWLQLQEKQALPLVLLAWFLCLVVGGRFMGSLQKLWPMVLAGLGSAMIGLLILGSRLVDPSARAPGDVGVQVGGEIATGVGSVTPQVWLIVPAFLALGATLGALAHVFLCLLPRSKSTPNHLAALAKVCVLATAPLLFVGGLVTSTDSGMAVPDWPASFNANMFLYPLGPRVQPVVGETYTSIFLEHAHRLFGSLIGLTTLAFLAFTLMSNASMKFKVFVLVIFVFVVAQGLLGGMRVIHDARVMALVHGVCAQLIFGALVSAAAILSPSRAFDHLCRTDVPTPGGLSRVRVLTTAALHITILQLIFGATYRHFRDGPGGTHALWAHIGLSFVVAALGAWAGAKASGAGGDFGDKQPPPLFRAVRVAGVAMMIIVALQFFLGWLTYFLGGVESAAPSVAQALLRTVHQANGALYLATAATASMLAKRISRSVAEAPETPPGLGEAAILRT